MCGASADDSLDFQGFQLAFEQLYNDNVALDPGAADELMKAVNAEGEDDVVAPRVRRADSTPMHRGGATAGTRIVRGDESRRRRGRDADGPWRRVAAPPRLARG